ncbi:MAG: response regulator [Planctomycetes bacterium]|nr:response regulator [Planctomycetota bacterium]
MDAIRPHILVVDDLADAADSLSELLALWDYDAEPHYSGVTALEAARSHKPDAVLLDIGMPRMTGFQFALLFRALPGCGTIPVLAITGYDLLTRQAREVGIDHYLVKPADPDLLRELLGRLIVCPKPLQLWTESRPLRKRRFGEQCVTV